MTNWQSLIDEAPGFAAGVEARLLAFKHLTMATIRADGGPRISGNEIRLTGGEILLAGMPSAWRWADLRRDPRVAIHSGSADPDEKDPTSWAGDAKISGTATEITDPERLRAFAGGEEQMPPGEFALFEVAPAEVTWIRIADSGDKLVIETWRPGKGVTRQER